MNIQYFKASWGDIKNSPGWFGKLCLLALLNFIPIFGQIVSYGYLYGWAREIAWGTHEPLPSRIFGNEDGKLYRRGWFVFVLTFVFMLIPYFVMGMGNSLQGVGITLFSAGRATAAASAWGWLGAILSFIGWIGVFFVSILSWIGCMRIAIYDRLSAGFQFSKIWKMLRHDTGGIMRIFGMQLLFSFIIGIILTIFVTIVVVIVMSIGISGVVAAGYSVEALQHMSNAQAAQVMLQFFASAGFVIFLSIIVGGFVFGVALLFVQMLVTRAVGYWTMQFDVPHWGGQDAPLPFEMAGAPQPSQPIPPQAAPPINPNSPYASAYQTRPITPDPGYTPPTAPIGSMTPTAPGGQGMPTAPNGQAMPTVPVGQPMQTAPVNQAMPTAPVGQAAPTASAEFVAPADSVLPEEAVEPSDSSAPVELSIASDSVGPIEAAHPAVSAGPAQANEPAVYDEASQEGVGEESK